MTERLKPCPFCRDHSVKIRPSGLGHSHYIDCVGCDARSGLSPTVEGAVAEWNRIADAAAVIREADAAPVAAGPGPHDPIIQGYKLSVWGRDDADLRFAMKSAFERVCNDGPIIPQDGNPTRGFWRAEMAGEDFPPQAHAAEAAPPSPEGAADLRQLWNLLEEFESDAMLHGAEKHPLARLLDGMICEMERVSRLVERHGETGAAR